MPYIYWTIENVDLADDIKKSLVKNFPYDFRLRKAAFNYTCDKIKRLLNGNFCLSKPENIIRININLINQN